MEQGTNNEVVVGDKMDVEQRSRENDGHLFFATECFSRGWET